MISLDKIPYANRLRLPEFNQMSVEHPIYLSLLMRILDRETDKIFYWFCHYEGETLINQETGKAFDSRYKPTGWYLERASLELWRSEQQKKGVCHD